MHKDNMTFGSQGINHYWWKFLDYETQLKEIKQSITYFKKIKAYNNNFSVCYPYGSYNSHTFKILKKFNIKFALTTQANSINKNNLSNRFTYPRYDTNDFKI